MLYPLVEIFHPVRVEINRRTLYISIESHLCSCLCRAILHTGDAPIFVEMFTLETAGKFSFLSVARVRMSRVLIVEPQALIL